MTAAADDRELIDYLDGEGKFSEKLKLEVRQLKQVYGHTAMQVEALTKRQDKAESTARTRHSEVMTAIGGLRRQVSYPAFSEDDADAITGVESHEGAIKAARHQRAKAAAEELQRKEAEAKASRARLTAQVATGIAILAGILQGLQLAGVIK